MLASLIRFQIYMARTYHKMKLVRRGSLTHVGAAFSSSGRHTMISLMHLQVVRPPLALIVGELSAAARGHRDNCSHTVTEVLQE